MIYLKCMIWALQIFTFYLAVISDSVEFRNDTLYKNETSSITIETANQGDLNEDPAEFFNTIATPCVTPNEDNGLCVEIQNCPVLLEDLYNKDAHDFLRKSRCGITQRENPKRPRVCCGPSGFHEYFNSRNPLPKLCGQQLIPFPTRILGGEETSLGEFPWMALVFHKNRFSYLSRGCSAFLIHAMYLLTAAHCVLDSLARGPPYEIVLGEHNTETEEDCNPSGMKCINSVKRMRIQKVISHPEYKKENRNRFYDIALIQLKKEVEFTDYIQPICIPTKKYDDVPEYWLSGWGKTEAVELSHVKLKVALSPFPLESCENLFRSIRLSIIPSQICAGGETGIDSCIGDSGGPLMFPLNGTTWYASGLVSYGIGCGRYGWPGVYTRVFSYTQWITDEILKTSQAADEGL